MESQAPEALIDLIEYEGSEERSKQQAFTRIRTGAGYCPSTVACSFSQAVAARRHPYLEARALPRGAGLLDVQARY